MKQIIGLLLILSLLLVLGSGRAAAHELKEDHGVDVVLHIEPDDNPVAGQAVRLELQFGSIEGSFSVHDYKLRLAAEDAGQSAKSVDITPINAEALSQGTAPITFDRAAVYDLVVTGTPLVPGAPAFKVDFLTRVIGNTRAEPGTTGNGEEVLLTSGLSMGILLAIASRNLRRGGRYSS